MSLCCVSGEHREADRVKQISEHNRDVAEGIARSVRRFVHALHDVSGGGRPPNKVRQAMQVIATAVSRAAALAPSRVTVKEIGDALGLNPRMISRCTERFDALTDCDWEQLFDDRGAERADKLPSEWKEFATLFWTDEMLADEQGSMYNYVRASEKKSDEVRDPTDRKSDERFRIHWLQENVGVMYQEMVLRRGTLEFGDGFHCSWKEFLLLRPFYVRKATRETCMCVYHMRWDEFASGLLTYRKTMRQQGVSKCSCSIPQNSTVLRKALICERPADGPSMDKTDCSLQRCEECKQLKRFTSASLGMCDLEMRDPGEGLALMVKYESYEKIQYRTKDGTLKDRKDFVSKQVPFSTFKEEFDTYWPKFIAHHNDAKWLDNDFIALKSKLPRGRAAFVIDSAENYSHQPRFEHQSKYFSQVQTTILPSSA